jgi:hypothetical protein
MEDRRAPVPGVAMATCWATTSFCGLSLRLPHGIADTPCCLATYLLVRRRHPPPPPAILPRPWSVSCIASQCCCHQHRHCAYRGIWRPDRPPYCARHRRRGWDSRGMVGAMVFHKYGLYPSEQASLWVAKLGQPSKEGEVVDLVIRQTGSTLIHCHMLSDGRVTADAAHGWACHL